MEKVCKMLSNNSNWQQNRKMVEMNHNIKKQKPNTDYLIRGLLRAFGVCKGKKKNKAFEDGV